jgi:hypothetical protein
MDAPADIIEAATAILALEGTGRYYGCTATASRDEWARAAQAALDGEWDELDLLLDMDAAELWLMPEWAQDDWLATRNASARAAA